MNRFILTCAMALAFFPVFSGLAAAQQPASSPAQQTAEPLGENEAIPFMRSEEAPASDEPSSAGLLLKTVASMVFIIGLIFVGAWGAKKLGYGNKAASPADGTALSVLTSVSLGNGRTVSTIRFGARVLLVGSTPQSFTLLAEDEDGPAGEMPAPRSVAELLAEGNANFDSELHLAENRLGGYVSGGKAS